MIQVIFSYLALGGEPNVGETLGVANTFFEDADDIRPATDVGVHETINELGRTGLSLRVETVKRGLETFKVNPRGIFRVENQRKIVGVIEPRHDDQGFSIDYAMLWNIGARQIAGPEDSFVNKMTKGILVDSMAGADPANRALARGRLEGVQSSLDKGSLFNCVE